MPAVPPARAPTLAPVGATPGKPFATSGCAAVGVGPGIGPTGDGVDGAAAVQFGGTDSCPMDADSPTPADIGEPATPEISGAAEPRPAAMSNDESRPSPSLPAAVPGARKLPPVKSWAACNGLIAPVDVNVFQKLAFGPQAVQKLSSWELPDEPPLSRPSSSESADGVDVDGDAMPCSVLGTAEVNCDNGACVVAATCPAVAPGAVVGGAVVNDGTVDADDDCAA